MLLRCYCGTAAVLPRFEAGVACVGLGSGLIRNDLVAAGDFETLAADVRAVLATIDGIRNS